MLSDKEKRAKYRIGFRARVDICPPLRRQPVRWALWGSGRQGGARVDFGDLGDIFSGGL